MAENDPAQEFAEVMKLLWTHSQNSGAIFNGNGTIIGIADPTSAAAIAEMHNREVRAAIRTAKGWPFRQRA